LTSFHPRHSSYLVACSVVLTAPIDRIQLAHRSHPAVMGSFSIKFRNFCHRLSGLFSAPTFLLCANPCLQSWYASCLKLQCTWISEPCLCGAVQSCVSGRSTPMDDSPPQSPSGKYLRGSQIVCLCCSAQYVFFVNTAHKWFTVFPNRWNCSQHTTFIRGRNQIEPVCRSSVEEASRFRFVQKFARIVQTFHEQQNVLTPLGKRPHFVF
jgi:hypothetical protein